MTTDQALEEMRIISRKYKDHPGAGHKLADDLMCKILRKTGYYETAEAFEKMKKHYHE